MSVTEGMVNLAEAKSHLRIDGTDSDALITTMIIANPTGCSKETDGKIAVRIPQNIYPNTM